MKVRSPSTFSAHGKGLDSQVMLCNHPSTALTVASKVGTAFASMGSAGNRPCMISVQTRTEEAANLRNTMASAWPQVSFNSFSLAAFSPRKVAEASACTRCTNCTTSPSFCKASRARGLFFKTHPYMKPRNWALFKTACGPTTRKRNAARGSVGVWWRGAKELCAQWRPDNEPGVRDATEAWPMAF